MSDDRKTFRYVSPAIEPDGSLRVNAGDAPYVEALIAHAATMNGPYDLLALNAKLASARAWLAGRKAK